MLDGQYMDKITEVELALDGYHLHPASKLWGSQCFFETLSPVCETELVPLILHKYYVMACKTHAKELDGNGWTLWKR
jgi:hypothetical protein